MGARITTIQNIDLLEAMADQIRDALDDVTDVEVQVEPRMVLNPSPPCIDMWPGDTGRDAETRAFDDEGGWFFTVRARVSTADTEAGQDLLLAFMDDINPLSVGTALFDEPTLGGVAADTAIVSQTGYVLFPDPSEAGALLGCQWTVLVIRADS